MKTLYPIVGLKHRDAATFVVGLPSGEPLILKREPTNPYDPNAVQVWARNKMLGYIPKKDNPGLALAMDGKPDFAEALANGQKAKLVFSANSRYPHAEVEES